MADTNLLAALLSGSNPLAPQMLGGYQGAQLSDAALNPAYAHNEGPLGALAKTIAGFSGGNQLRQAIEATTAAQNAARPELLAALNNQAGPMQYAADNPGMNQLGLSQILSRSPQEIQQYIEAARLGRANAPSPAAPAVGSPAVAVAPTVWPKLGPATGGSAVAPAPATAAGLTTGRESLTDPIAAIAALPVEQRPAAIAKMTAPQKAAYFARLRAMQGGRGNASGP